MAEKRRFVVFPRMYMCMYVVLQIAIFSLETRFETAFRKKFAPAAQQKLELGIYIYNIQPEPRVRATGGMPTVMFTIGVKPDLRRTIYAEQNPNTAKNHPLRLSEQRPSRLLYGERCPSHIGR